MISKRKLYIHRLASCKNKIFFKKSRSRTSEKGGVPCLRRCFRTSFVIVIFETEELTAASIVVGCILVVESRWKV
jgi:hypothetical protein